MTTYQPEVIQRFADRLYARSATAIVISTLLGVLVGVAVDPFIHQTLPPNVSNHLPEWSSATLLGVIGLLQGFERAFLLRLQAQTALCQLQIERNTRPRTTQATDQPPVSHPNP